MVANALVGQPRSNTSDISVSASDTSTVPPANTAGNASVLGSSGRQHHPADDHGHASQPVADGWPPGSGQAGGSTLPTWPTASACWLTWTPTGGWHRAWIGSMLGDVRPLARQYGQVTGKDRDVAQADVLRIVGSCCRWTLACGRLVSCQADDTSRIRAGCRHAASLLCGWSPHGRSAAAGSPGRLRGARGGGGGTAGQDAR